MVILPSWIHQILSPIVMNDLKFICYVTYSLFMKCPIWASIFLSKALVSVSFYNIIVLFSTMVEKCSRTLIFCLLFCFVTSSGVIGLRVLY